MTTAKGEDLMLLVSTNKTIYQYDLSTNQKLKLVDNLSFVRALDYWFMDSVGFDHC